MIRQREELRKELRRLANTFWMGPVCGHTLRRL